MLAVVVSFGMRFIVNLLAFWVLDWRGLLALSSAFTTVASGFVIPIAFFPTWAARLFTVLPWASMIQIADRRLHRPPHRRRRSRAASRSRSSGRSCCSRTGVSSSRRAAQRVVVQGG